MRLSADIDVNPAAGARRARSTHELDGTTRLEAGTAGDAFALGQLFTRWRVQLSSVRSGGTRSGTARGGAHQLDARQLHPGGPPPPSRGRRSVGGCHEHQSASSTVPDAPVGAGRTGVGRHRGGECCRLAPVKFGSGTEVATRAATAPGPQHPAGPRPQLGRRSGAGSAAEGHHP